MLFSNMNNLESVEILFELNHNGCNIASFVNSMIVTTSGKYIKQFILDEIRSKNLNQYTIKRITYYHNLFARNIDLNDDYLIIKNEIITVDLDKVTVNLKTLKNTFLRAWIYFLDWNI